MHLFLWKIGKFVEIWFSVNMWLAHKYIAVIVFSETGLDDILQEVCSKIHEKGLQYVLNQTENGRDHSLVSIFMQPEKLSLSLQYF